MNNAQDENRAKNGIRGSHDGHTAEVGKSLKKRVIHAKELAETVREKAEVAFRDKPYLVPVAAGALGLGVGLLLGSRLTRFLVFTAVGTLVTETFGPELKRIGSDLVREMGKNLGESGYEEEEEGDLVES